MARFNFQREDFSTESSPSTEEADMITVPNSGKTFNFQREDFSIESSPSDETSDMITVPETEIEDKEEGSPSDEGCPKCNSTDSVKVDVPYSDEMYACLECSKTYEK